VNQEAFGNPVANPNLQFFPYAVFIERLEEWHQATFFMKACGICVYLLYWFISAKGQV